jgi:hypothetical protein
VQKYEKIAFTDLTKVKFNREAGKLKEKEGEGQIVLSWGKYYSTTGKKSFHHGGTIFPPR